METLDVLRELNIGRRVAEEESQELAAYFVETDQWRRIFAGDVDIVYGPKGSGKSAIYATLLARTNDLFDRGILLVSAENPQGAPAFKELVADPPTSEQEFVGLWKLYILSLFAKVVDDYGISNDPARKLLQTVSDAGLAPKERSLGALIQAALSYVRAMLKPKAFEGEVKLDPATGAPVGLAGRIVFREPTEQEREAGILSLEDVFLLAETALAQDDYEGWLLFDRLDVAFAGSPELERNALRALFKVYLDFLPHQHLSTKIFLRSDIWRAITEAGFREASHITRSVTID